MKKESKWKYFWKQYFAIWDKLFKDIKDAFKMRKGAKNGNNKEASSKAIDKKLSHK